MAAMLVMLPRLFDQTFISVAQGSFILNFVTIGPVAVEEMFVILIL